MKGKVSVMMKLKDVINYRGFEFAQGVDNLFYKSIENNQIVMKACKDVSDESDCDLGYYWYYYGDTELRTNGRIVFDDKDWDSFYSMKNIELASEEGEMLYPFPDRIGVLCEDELVGSLPMDYYTFEHIDYNECENG